MSSVEYDNAVYAEISSETKSKQENEYEVPKKVVPETSTKCNDPYVSSSTRSLNKSKCTIILTLAVVVLLLAVVAACIAFALEMTKMKTEMTRLSTQMLTHNQALLKKLNEVTLQITNSELISQQAVNEVTLQITNSEMISQQAVNNVSEILDNFTVQVTQDYTNKIQQLASFSNTSLQQLSENFFSLEDQLQVMHSYLHSAPSCASLPLSFPSGYYWVLASNGSAVHVYCDMTRSCGGVTGGWMRVVELDMTNSRHQCPSGLRQHTDFNLRTCGNLFTGCSSAIFSTFGMNYTSVCGRVIGYQVGAPDAFYSNLLSINSNYVDGVSLTHGSPREHIWTFAAALDEIGTDGPYFSCPCIRNDTNRPSPQIPSFVGNDYFCDTGSQNRYQFHVIYSADPLWDGAGCGRQSTCCSFNNPPWFYKQLLRPTTDDIEMRLCRDDISYNENILIQEIDLYIHV